MSNRSLCIATDDGVVVLIRSQDGAWGLETGLHGRQIQCLAVDPLAPRIVYAGSAVSGVYRSDDGGRNWRHVAPESGSWQVFSLVVSPSRRSEIAGAVFAGTEPSALYVSEGGGQRWRELSALRSIPSARTWSFPPRPWTSHMRWIALSPFAAGLVLAGIELGGVMRSTDGGETWEDHRLGAHRDCHALAIHPATPGRAYEAAGDGAAQSFDDGETWQQVDYGLARRYCWTLAVDPVDPDRWYVSASPGPRQAHHLEGAADSVIYRRTTGRWEELRGRGLPSPNASLFAALATDPQEPGRLYAGLRSSGVYTSEDHGQTWESVGASLPGIAAMTVCG